MLSKLMNLFSNSEVYLKWNFNIDVFIFKLRSTLQVGFLNLCYAQTQKYTGSICQFDVFLFKLRSILEVDFLNLRIYLQIQKYS